METAIVSDIQRFSLDDGPGIRTTVFFKGCNLKCPWCHNPETLRREPKTLYYRALCTGCGQCAAGCPNGVRKICGAAMTAEEVMRVVRKDAAFYRASGGGVTLSGGEPLLWPAFCRELAVQCRGEGIPVLLDTAASVSPEVLQGLLPHVDLCYVDLKAADGDDYARIVGGNFGLVFRNMELLAESSVETTVRVPVVPGYTDAPDYAKRLAGVVRASGLRSVRLLPFHRLGSGKYAALSLAYAYDETEPPDEGMMNAVAAAFTEMGLSATIT